MKHFLFRKICILQKLAYLLFPILIIVTLLAIVLDIYKYLGFFKKHFLLDSSTLSTMTFFTGLIISVFPTKKNILIIEYLEKIFNKINFVVLPTSIFLYFYFNDLLVKKGINYIFSKYHIQPQNLPLLISFSAFMIFVFIYKQIPDKTV